MTFWVTTRRIARYGVVGFFRNGFVSLAAVLIMTLTLFVISALLIAGAALNATLEQLTEKVDVNVYFSTNATEAEVGEIQRSLEALPEVASVEYTSAEEALSDFRSRHEDDLLTLQALDELSDNPLGPSLAIRAEETSQYESIASFLETSPAAQAIDSEGEPLIAKVNYFQNKAVIDRLANIIETSQNFGIAIAVFLGIASVLIAFNTIRLAIYTARDEIAVMRLVGAGKWYVRGPFIVAGVLYGITSSIIVMIALYPITLWIGPASQRFFGTFNTFTYYTQEFALLALIVIGVGVLLGAFSSYLAVHRYFKE